MINRRFAAILPKNTEGTEWTYYHYVNASGDELVPLDALVLFPLTIGSPQARTRFIQITEPLFDKMNAYAHAHEGFPGRSSGSWWRMFYLSAATVTTLGYGDITPISPTTRSLMAKLSETAPRTNWYLRRIQEAEVKANRRVPRNQCG